MDVFSSHSSLKPNRIGIARIIAKQIINSNIERPLFVFQGLSGSMFAARIQVCIEEISSDYKYGMMYVRKITERGHNHGNDIESLHPADKNYNNYDLYTPIFVDRFIGQGNTFRRCVEDGFFYRNDYTKYKFAIERWQIITERGHWYSQWDESMDAIGRYDRFQFRSIKKIEMEEELGFNPLID